MSNCKNSHTTTRRYGFIEAICGNVATVRLLRFSACSSCESSDKCHSHESKELRVMVDSCDVARHKVGDRVCVELSDNTALKAVCVGFIVPIALILASVAVVRYSGVGDLWSACSSLAILALYYIFIYMLRDKMNKAFSVRLVD